MVSDKIIAQLKSDIERKLGKEIRYEKDFIELGNIVLEETNQKISVSTLKRFFGKVISNFKPSQYTLDTLVAYLNFEDWQAYLTGRKEIKHFASAGNTWDELKFSALQITENSLASLKLKTGYNSNLFFLRAFARQKFEEFQKSSKKATLFAAPDGYGKSSMLIQLVEKYFLKPDAKYKNDIISLIDGGIFFKLYSKESNIGFLDQLLDFNLQTSLSYFYRQKPDQIKGRIWLIIDDVDDIFFDKEKYHRFVANLMGIIMAHSENTWSKFIFTCRPENLDAFIQQIKKKPLLRSFWFDENFHETMKAAINVPLYSESEIRCILKKLKFEHPLEFLKINNSEILDVIRHPIFLSLFAEQYKQNENISEFSLLSRYVGKTLYTTPYRDEKAQLIDNFFELCNLAKESNSVKKELLTYKGLSMGYRELISCGLIYEYMVPGELLDQHVYVKFSQSSIFEFILLGKWLRTKPLDIKLILEIKEFYHNNNLLQCKLMQLSAKLLLHRAEFDAIRQLHEEFEKSLNIPVDASSPLPLCMTSVAEVIRKSLRNNSELRIALYPWVTKSRLGHMLYSEEAFDMDGLVVSSGENLALFQNNKSPSAIVFISYMRFLQGFLSLNKTLCTNEYVIIQKIKVEEIDIPLFASFYFDVQIMYQSHFGEGLQQNVLEEILSFSKYLSDKKLQPSDSLPKFESSIIYTLNLCNRFDELVLMSDYVEANFNFSESRDRCFFQFYKLCCARALLHRGKKEKAMAIFQSLDEMVFPENMKYFMKVQVDLNKIDFLLAQNKNRAAFELIELIKSIASTLQFDYFFNRAGKLYDSGNFMIL